tara:strand:+ start:152 stop:601 length:450 start_codon:yes stop_codon:yes gene_type:complete
MKLRNKLFFFTIILLILNSCVAKRTITDIQERIKIDTIYKTKIIKEVERFTDTLVIDKPCDSLGNLKPFKQLIKTKQGNITLVGLNNQITQQIDLNGYKDVLEETYKTKYDSFVKNYNKEVVKYRIPLWVFIYIVASALVIFLLLRIRL